VAIEDIASKQDLANFVRKYLEDQPKGALGGWQELSLSNGFSNYGAFAVRIDPRGQVQFKGELRGGTTALNTFICQLPSGFEPPIRTYVNAVGSTSRVGTFLINRSAELRVSDDHTLPGDVKWNFCGVSYNIY
jgi:hypothetical protein